MLSLVSVENANIKASDLLNKMRERFPGKLCTIEIVHWEDDTFSVTCKYSDYVILHIYEYKSSNDVTEYRTIDANENLTFLGEVLSTEVIS